MDAALEVFVREGLRGKVIVFCLPSFLFLRLIVSTSCGAEPTASIFSRICGSARDARGLCDGSIWPKTGCASIV
jgi:hypothetical protein